MQRLTFVGPINAYTGYGLHSQQIIRDIERLSDAFIAVRPTETNEPFGAKIPMDIKQKIVRGIQPEDWELLLMPPNFAPTPGKKTVFFTMWEAENLPKAWVNSLNRAEAIVLPCNWNVDCFRASGVSKPIHRIPLGINTDAFHYSPPQVREEFVFGAAGRMGGGGKRKGLNEVIDCFQKAFPRLNPRTKHVRLKIKAFPDCGVIPTDDDRIEVTAGYLTEHQMAKWYASLDCFVSMSRSEGWGLMPHQAMAVGRPAIACIFGGHAEYMTEQNTFRIDWSLVPTAYNYEGCGMWAEPKTESVIAMMRHCACYPEKVHYRGVVASRDVKHLSWENSNRQLLKILQDCGTL